MSKSGYSRIGLFEAINHYNSNEKKTIYLNFYPVAHLMTINHYDSNEKKTGESRPGFNNYDDD